MKILILTYEYPPVGGGAGIVCQHLVHQWKGNGHEILVLTSGYGSNLGISRDGNTEIIRLDTKRGSLHQANPIQMLRWAWKAISYIHAMNRDFDVALANFILPGGIPATWLKSTKKIPFVVLTHGHDIPGAAANQMIVYHLLLQRILCGICRKASAIIVLNKSLEKLLSDWDPSLVKKVKVIPNGLEDCQIDKPVLKDDHLKILWAGRLVHQKRPQLLIKILSNLKFPFEAHLYGDGPLRKEIEKAVSKSSNKDSINIHGHVDREILHEAMLNSHVLVHTSKFEAMSLVQLEAFSRCLFVITSPVNGTEYWLKEGISGNSIDSNYLEDWIQALELINKNKHVNTGSSLNKNVESIQQNIAWEIQAKKYIELFQAVVTRNRI